MRFIQSAAYSINGSFDERLSSHSADLDAIILPQFLHIEHNLEHNLELNTPD